MKFAIPCLISFMLTVVVTPIVIRCATMCNCLDVPGARRLHARITPRWGGAAFFAGVLPILFMENGSGSLTSYIIASLVLVSMGMLDDLKTLGWKTKFSIITAAATLVIFGGNLTFQHIGVYGPLGRVELGLLSIPFTYISIIGITNAINLLDGLDGLAGGVSLLGFLFMGIAALLAGNLVVAVICCAFVGALAAFLLFNFPHAKIFMGDTGSLFLGFSLAITAVLLTQDAHATVDSMFPLLVLLIPIFDTLRVLLVRLLNGKNPFQADNLHLHYLIAQKNISPAKVTLLFWALTALLGSIALSLTNRTSLPYLNTVLIVTVLLSLFARSLMQNRQTREPTHNSTLHPSGLQTNPDGLSRHDATGQLYARKGDLLSLKWVVALGVVLLPAHALASEARAFRAEQDMGGIIGSPAVPAESHDQPHIQTTFKLTVE